MGTSRILAVVVALLAGAAAAPAAEPAAADHVFIRHPNDVAEDGSPLPLGDRVPVLFVHGLLADDLVLRTKVHPAFSVLWGYLGNAQATGKEAFKDLMPVLYNYTPTKPYRQLGAEFAARVKERWPDRTIVVVAHSAGALLTRWASTALSIGAVIGIAPAHGGSPGASIIFANEKIMTEGRITKEHYETFQETRAGMGLPEEVTRSVTWDNADKVITEKEEKEYGVVVQHDLPPFSYPRLDHYGLLEHFVAPFGGIDFLSEKDKRGKDLRQREWEAIGAYSELWKINDGIVVPYPETKADEEYPVWRKYWKGIGHRELFIEKQILALVFEQILDVARQLREGS